MYQLAQAVIITSIVGTSALYIMYCLFPHAMRFCQNKIYQSLGWEAQDKQPNDKENAQENNQSCNSHCSQCSGCSLILFKR